MNDPRATESGEAGDLGPASAEHRRLAALPAGELHTLFVRGDTPDPDALAGWEYRGRNAPAWAPVLGIRKFIKGFERGPDGALRGYNIAAEQNRADEAWRARPPLRLPFVRGPRPPRRFGYFAVLPVDAGARDNAFLHALLLDYGRGGNHPLDPSRTVRDYLVRATRGSDDLLLGKAFLAAGPLRVPVGHFLLERARRAAPA